MITVLFGSVRNYISNSIDGNEVFLLFPYLFGQKESL